MIRAFLGIIAISHLMFFDTQTVFFDAHVLFFDSQVVFFAPHQIFLLWWFMMNFDNKTLLIFGLIVGGIVCLYLHNNELASAIFGGLIGYLSKDITVNEDEDVLE